MTTIFRCHVVVIPRYFQVLLSRVLGISLGNSVRSSALASGSFLKPVYGAFQEAPEEQTPIETDGSIPAWHDPSSNGSLTALVELPVLAQAIPVSLAVQIAVHRTAIRTWAELIKDMIRPQEIIVFGENRGLASRLVACRAVTTQKPILESMPLLAGVSACDPSLISVLYGTRRKKRLGSLRFFLRVFEPYPIAMF